MLNKILFAFLNKGTIPNPAQTDDYEQPNTYKGYILPLRYLLALRYLKQKRSVLEGFRKEGVFPIPSDDFKTHLLEQLSSKKILKAKPPFLSPIMTPWFIYPVFIGIFLISIGVYNHWLSNQRLEATLANRLPYYSDLLHQSLQYRYSGYETAHKKISEEALKEREYILSQLPNIKGLKPTMEKGLRQLAEKETSTETIMQNFKAVNQIFDQHKMPYYITPKVLSVACSDFIEAPLEEMITIKRMEALLTGGKPEVCHTTMLTVYHVAKRTQLDYGDVPLPLFHVRRIDKVPAVDGALGLTFGNNGLGSIILLDRIQEFATDSVIPALTFQGRNTLIPLWLQGYYDVEETISKQYKKTLTDIYQDKDAIKQLKTTAKTILKNKQRMATSRLRQTLQRADGASQDVLGGSLDVISGLLGANVINKDKKSTTVIDYTILEKLNQALLPSIEYHEAYHQIDKSQWKEPEWVATVLDELSDGGKEHALEELGAYLTQLTYTKDGGNIWLTKLLFFSLNAMMRNQAEFYSSSLILKTMHDLYQNKTVDVDYNISVDDKIEIYKTFAKLDKAYLKVIAERAYIELFRQPIPEMKEHPF